VVRVLWPSGRLARRLTLAVLATAAQVAAAALPRPAPAPPPVVPGVAGRGASALQPRFSSLAAEPLPLSTAGDWVVFRVEEQARETDVTLQVQAVSPRGIQLSVHRVGTGLYQQLLVPIMYDRWSWEGLPDLLPIIAGQEVSLPRVFFQLRGLAAAETDEREKYRELEVEWAGSDSTLGGIPHRQRAVVLVRPDRRLGGIVEALLEDHLGPPSTRLRSQIRIRRVREGGRAAWPAERARYRAR